MPRYKVVKIGFHDSKLYDPDGKRRVLYTDKPFPTKNKKEQVPSWLARMKNESASEKSDREAVEANQINNDIEKVEQDQTDIADASFLGEGESSIVETL